MHRVEHILSTIGVSSPSQIAGLTVFMSGGSRGIGLAIAKELAKHKANIVIAAKTAKPHPTLPGTVYTAAKEIEAAGGACLPVICDIRFEDQVQNAVNAAVAKFGGIDICINNASAISLTNTESTSMKTYDLMNSINSRGTFMVSKLCIPHLKKSRHGRILMLSPPLNMEGKWFKNNVAYSIAKYGMSMCVLGMSEELKKYNIAVNALWPRTAIATAAVMNVLGGQKSIDRCRTTDIMADAALSVLCKDTSVTGEFFIDDDVLRAEGVTDFSKYRVSAHIQESQLMPDFFV